MLLELCSTPGTNPDVVNHGGEKALYKALEARNITHIRILEAKGGSIHVKGAKHLTCRET